MTTQTLKVFQELVDTEEYLQFFEIPYDQQFVNINRLHILKQFSLLIAEVDRVFANLSETERLEKYRQALTEAYSVFQSASPLETKLFKVFQEKHKNIVLLENLTTTPGVN